MSTLATLATARRALTPGKAFLSTMGLLMLGGALHAAAFTPGGVVVFRAGDGTVGTGARPVFLDEYTITGAGTPAVAATLAQSIAMPAATAGAQRAFMSEIHATSSTSGTGGTLNLTADGKYLVLPGYECAAGTVLPLAGNTANVVPRVIGRVSYDGTVDTSTASTSTTGGPTHFRSVASADGLTFYATQYTALGGVQMTTFGTVETGTATPIVTTSNMRQLKIVQNTLVGSTAGGVRAYGTVGALPNSDVTATVTPYFTGTTTTMGYGLCSLAGGPAGYNTIYVADATNIKKFCNVGGVWTAAGTIANAEGEVRGITVRKVGARVDVYFTSVVGATQATYTGHKLSTFSDTHAYTTDAVAFTAAPPTVYNLKTTVGGDGTTVYYKGVSQSPEAANSAELVSFNAAFGRPGVKLTWVTGAENDMVGFNLWRAATANGKYVKVNPAIIPALGDPFTGKTYTFNDASAVKGNFYKLEDVDRDGTTTFHGPVFFNVVLNAPKPPVRGAIRQVSAR